MIHNQYHSHTNRTTNHTLDHNAATFM